MEIRDAYRSLARRYHPDHEPGAAATMAAINEAYRVLGEPARRAVYDASLRGTGSAAGPSATPARSAPDTSTVPRPPLPPARYPWKLVLVMFLLGTAVVLIGAALYHPKDPGPPDNLLEPGSCVTLEPNGDAREANCTSVAGELVVERVDRDGRGLSRRHRGPSRPAGPRPGLRVDVGTVTAHEHRAVAATAPTARPAAPSAAVAVGDPARHPPSGAVAGPGDGRPGVRPRRPGDVLHRRAVDRGPRPRAHRVEAGARRAGPGDARGRALAGWILGLVGVLGFVAFMVTAIATGDLDDDDTVGVQELRAGQCIDVPDEDVVFEVPELDCDEPHDAEVFLVRTLDGTSYPGDEAVQARATEVCSGDAFEEYFAVPYGDSSLDATYLWPSADNWRDGDHEVVCVAVNGSGVKLTEPKAGAGD